MNMAIHLPIYQGASDEEFSVERPKTRADCLPGGFNEVRPCPFATCKHHLFRHVRGEEGMTEEDLEKMAHTCVLDVADVGGMTLEEVGTVLGLTRERVRQLEAAGLRKLRNRTGTQRLKEEI